MSFLILINNIEKPEFRRQSVITDNSNKLFLSSIPTMWNL